MGGSLERLLDLHQVPIQQAPCGDKALGSSRACSDRAPRTVRSAKDVLAGPASASPVKERRKKPKRILSAKPMFNTSPRWSSQTCKNEVFQDCGFHGNCSSGYIFGACYARAQLPPFVLGKQVA